jgi:hypothetical protein
VRHVSDITDVTATQKSRPFTDCYETLGPVKDQCEDALAITRGHFSMAFIRGEGRMQEAMRLRRSTVEHPFATLKYRIFGHPLLHHSVYVRQEQVV